MVLPSSSFHSNLHPEEPTSPSPDTASLHSGVLYFHLAATHTSEPSATTVSEKSLSFQLGLLFLSVRPSTLKPCYPSLWALSSITPCFSNMQSCLEKLSSQCPWDRSPCFRLPLPVDFHPFPHQKLLHSPHHICTNLFI